MTNLKYGFETGSDGTALATTGAASGDTNWAAITGAGVKQISTDVAFRGTRSGKFSRTASTNTYSYVEWSHTQFPAAAGSTFYERFYFYLTAFPAFNFDVSAMYNGGATLAGALNIATDGTIRTLATGRALPANGQGVSILPLNQWVRLEWALAPCGGTGSVNQIKYYQNPFDIVPTEIIGTTSSTGTGTPAELRFGMCVNTQQIFPFYLDMIEADTVNPVGRIAPAQYRGWGVPLLAS